MQKKMKNEEFDHYIQSQFADEAITPPQQIEGAIFEAMAKNSRRKKLGVIGTGILVLGALAYGVNGTMNTAHVVTETPPVAVPVAAPVAACSWRSWIRRNGQCRNRKCTMMSCRCCCCQCIHCPRGLRSSGERPTR